MSNTSVGMDWKTKTREGILAEQKDVDSATLPDTPTQHYCNKLSFGIFLLLEDEIQKVMNMLWFYPPMILSIQSLKSPYTYAWLDISNWTAYEMDNKKTYQAWCMYFWTAASAWYRTSESSWVINSITRCLAPISWRNLLGSFRYAIAFLPHLSHLQC